MGHFTHPCQNDIVLKVDLEEEVPYFNAPIYTEDKNQIGKIDEIFGPIRDYFVSVKLSDNIKSKSFSKNDKVRAGISKKVIFPNMLCGIVTLINRRFIQNLLIAG